MVWKRIWYNPRRRMGKKRSWEVLDFSDSTREHGNSYLAIMEGVGLLGVVPFFTIVLMLLIKVGGVFAEAAPDLNVRQCSVPVAMILCAGLIHAGFEDWLFAVGYYLCVFFWVLAFAFIDVIPASPPAVHRPITDFSFGILRGSRPVIVSQR